MTRFALVAALGLVVCGWTALAADKFKPDPGFTRIDNGKNLDGWMGDRKDWTVSSDGVIHPKGKARSSIYSEKKHDSSVIIRVEFKAKAGSRGGVLIHGKELQLGDFKKTGPRDYADAAKALGEWNHLEFDISKDQAVVMLNGTVIEKAWEIGKDRTKGLGLQHDIGDIEFRHLQMKDKK